MIASQVNGGDIDIHTVTVREVLRAAKSPATRCAQHGGVAGGADHTPARGGGQDLVDGGGQQRGDTGLGGADLVGEILEQGQVGGQHITGHRSTRGG